MSIKLSYSNQALKGKLFINSAIGYVNSNEDFWNRRLNERTYQVFTHGLFMVNYLSDSYLQTNDERYIDLATYYLNNWLVTHHKSKLVWHETSVALRLTNILKYINALYSKSDVPIYLTELIVNHIEFLLDDENYRENNHGIMMDSRLASAINSLPVSINDYSSLIIKKVKERSRLAIDRDFSSTGLHLENSPDYHRLTVNWLSDIQENLILQDDTLGKEYVEKLKRAKEIEAIVAMPNNRYPILGDSSSGTFIGQKNYEDFVDKEAGRVIYHNEDLKSQLTFISGYGSKGHKQFDDLSFIFFDGNEVVFNDSGKYNYDLKDPIRKHMISPLAHNSLSLYKENYTVSNNMKAKEAVFINHTKSHKYYKLVQGVNNSYPNLKLVRTLIYFYDNTLLIYDDFSSTNQNTIAVNFNLGLGVRAKRNSLTEYSLIGKGTKYILKSYDDRMTSVLLDDSNYHVCGISDSFNKIKKNQRILFRKKTREGSFLTSITQENSDFNVNSFENRTLDLTLNNINLKISIDK